MDGHVWRIPTLLGVMACSALLLFAAAVVGLMITTRRNSAARKVATAAVLGVLALVSVGAVGEGLKVGAAALNLLTFTAVAHLLPHLRIPGRLKV